MPCCGVVLGDVFKGGEEGLEVVVANVSVVDDRSFTEVWVAVVQHVKLNGDDGVGKEE